MGADFLPQISDFCRLSGNVWPSSGTSEMKACYYSACLPQIVQKSSFSVFSDK